MNFKLMLSNIREKIKNRKKNHPKIAYRKMIPMIYVKFVILGLALTGMQASFLPQLVFCSDLFGEHACDPVGNYLVAISSLPGYLFTGKIMSFWQTAPGYVFFTILFFLSVLLYYLLGLFIDKQAGQKMDMKNILTLLVFTVLLILVAMLFALI